MTVNIQDFPQDVLTIIAAHIRGDGADQFELVCKSFHRAARTKTCTRYVLENRLRYLGRPLSDIATLPRETYYAKNLAVYVDYWQKIKTAEKVELDTKIAAVEKTLKELVKDRDGLQDTITLLPFYQRMKTIDYETRVRRPQCHYVKYLDDDARNYLTNDIVAPKIKLDIRALRALLEPLPEILENDIIALPASEKKYYVLFVYRNGGLLAAHMKVVDSKTYLPAVARPFLQKWSITKVKEIKYIYTEFVFRGYFDESDVKQNFLVD